MPRCMKKGREIQKGDSFIFMDRTGLRTVVVEEVQVGEAKVAVTVTDGVGGRKTTILNADEEYPLQ